MLNKTVLKGMMGRKKEKKEKIDETQEAQVDVKNEQEPTTEVEENTVEQELQEVKDKYLRLLAEFENYKKRTFREKLDTINTAARDTMLAILPVLDDFDQSQANG